MSVMRSAYATNDPAPEPRPGPTGTPCVFAQLMKSWTMRKYPENFIAVMTDSSRSSRSRYWSASIFRPVRAISVKRWSSPSRARRWMYESSVSPSGTWNLGRCLPTRSNSTLQRWAMRDELCTASRHSLPTPVVASAADAISSGPLM